MNSTRKINAFLAVSLFILLASFHPGDWIAFGPTTARAQDSSTNKKPRQRPNTKSEDEQDKPQGKTSISISVDLVSLQVLVSDKQGNIVTGLKRENFTIYEDNVKQEIANFAPIEADMTVAVLFENSKIIGYELRNEIWNAMYAFSKTLRKDDWVAVIGYDMRPTILCDFTKDRSKIPEALRVVDYPLWNESNLSDAVIDTIDRTQELEGKVAILLISTGLDTFSKHTYDEALKKCKESNASIYAISLGQNVRLRAEAYGSIGPLDSIDLQMADTRLRSFAEFTGGYAYFPRFTSEYPSIFATISGLLRSQYSIGYISSNTVKDGKFRKLRVEVKTDLTDNKGKPIKLNVVTRKGYIATQ
jgi:Ca-activated chloride channel homolog